MSVARMRSATMAVLVTLASAGCGSSDDGGIDAAGAAIDAAGSAIDGNGNAAPTASFTFTPECTSSNADPIAFSSTSTDPEGDTLTCSWLFGSGTPASATGCTVEGVTFPNVQPYTVRLTVDDGNGNTAMTTQSIAPCT